MATDATRGQIAYLAKEYHYTTDHYADGAAFGEYVCNCRTVAKRILGLPGVTVEVAK